MPLIPKPFYFNMFEGVLTSKSGGSPAKSTKVGLTYRALSCRLVSLNDQSVLTSNVSSRYPGIDSEAVFLVTFRDPTDAMIRADSSWIGRLLNRLGTILLS